MTLVDRISASPLAFMFGCVIWIPIACGIYMMVSWALSGELDWWEGILGVGLLIYLGFVGVNPPADWVSPIAFGVVVLIAIGLPGYRLFSDRKQLRQIDIDNLARDYEVLARQPNDPLRMMKMARDLADLGYFASAAAIGKRALAGFVKGAVTSEPGEIRAWESRIPPGTSPSLSCPKCSTQPPLEDIYCPGCGAQYLLDYAQGKWISKGATKNLLVAIAIAAMLFVAIPALALAGPLTAIIGIPLLLVLGGLVFWRTVRPAMKTT